jgi:hypothetical protein
VFAAQSECHFAGNTSEDFVRRVNHEPIALDFMALSGKSFHVDFLNNQNTLKWWFRHCFSGLGLLIYFPERTESRQV